MRARGRSPIGGRHDRTAEKVSRDGGGGLANVFGIHSVRVMLDRHPERIVSIKLLAGRDDPRVRQLEALASRAGRPVERVEAAQLNRLVGEVAHQGVVAQFEPQPAWTEDDLLAALQHDAKPLLLALDCVQDPHNLGACLRTADACGALAVIVPRDRAAQVSATVRKVAAGAADTTPVVSVTNLARALRVLKDAGLCIVGADPAGELAAHEADFAAGVVLVMGAEGTGLRQLTRQTCDRLVRLPRLGAVESLNVSVAAGMLLYEAVRQRTAGPGAAQD